MQALKMQALKTSEELKLAKGKIDSIEKWTKKVYATDSSGIPISVNSPLACRFCSVGALISSEIDGMEVDDFLTQAMGGSIVTFNDRSTHAEVMAAWDRAIALAEEYENKDEKIQ